MKLSRQFCDFCGVLIKQGDKFATMTVPKLSDGMAVDPTQLGEPTPAPVTVPHGFFAFTFAIDEGRTYDVCLECVRSFLVARFWALKQANQTMNRISDRKTRLQEVG